MSTANNNLDNLDGERGIPSVNNNGGPSGKRRAMGLIAVLIALALTGVVYWKYKKQSGDAAVEEKTLRVGNTVPARTFIEPPQKITPLSPATPIAPIAAPIPPSGSVGTAVELDKSASSLMVSTTSQQTNTFPHDGAGQGQAGGADQGNMSALLVSTRTNRRTADNLGNRNFLLAKGAFIDCVLQTRLDTTVAGMTACVVIQNIYSDDGKVLLIERGSTISGEYQANLRQGMARIFVLWNRIKTPNGVVINLDSPGTDPLGGAGLPGYVDNHFWQRFGAAVLLSLVDDSAQALSNSVSNSNSLRFENTGDTTENMATEALRNTINIPPTLYKNQGERVNVYVARDLDFSGVYDVVVQ
jgi:type IV secretion system protein VirB10